MEVLEYSAASSATIKVQARNPHVVLVYWLYQWIEQEWRLFGSNEQAGNRDKYDWPIEQIDGSFIMCHQSVSSDDGSACNYYLTLQIIQEGNVFDEAISDKLAASAGLSQHIVVFPLREKR